MNCYYVSCTLLNRLRLPILVFRVGEITGAVFGNRISDLFVHPIPSADIAGLVKSALKQVFQR
jgi:hypothetical protein